MNEGDEAVERDALDQLWLFVLARGTSGRGDREQKQYRPAIETYFKDKPVGTELFDGEHGVGLRKDNGSGTRFLDFEDTPTDLIEWAGKAGLLSLNVGALEGALKSSDLRIQHYAQQLNQHVHFGAGTKLTTIDRRGDR